MPANNDSSSKEGTRKSTRTPVKKSKKLWEMSDDENLEELSGDPLFCPDGNDSFESAEDSDWSNGLENKSKSKRKKRQSVKQHKPKKTAKAKRVIRKETKSSRRSSRVTKQAVYCESSNEDDDDFYELCDGQPLKVSPCKNDSVHKQSPRQPPKKQRKKSNIVKAKRKFPLKDDEFESSAVAVSPDQLSHLTSDALRNVRQTRSQVSYVEMSSDEESFDICDGQPIKRNRTSSQTSEVLLDSKDSNDKMSPSRPQSESDPIESDCNKLPSNDDVVMVKGQPILRSESLSSLAKENNFVVLKEGLNDSSANPLSSEPLYIWKLHGKLMQKFIQVVDSNVFESTFNFLANDEDTQDLYQSVNALVFSKKKDHYYAEIIACPENENLLEAITVKNNNAQTKTAKRGRPQKSSQSSNVKRFKSTQEEAAQGDSSEIISSTTLENAAQKKCSEEDVSLLKLLDTNFPDYLKTLLLAAVDHDYIQTHLQSAKVGAIDVALSSLAEKLLNDSKFNLDFLEDLNNRPVFLHDSDSEGHLCEAIEGDPPLSADRIVALKGPCYCRTSLVGEEESGAKKYFLSKRAAELSEAYHCLRHFKKKLFQHCVEKAGALTELHEQLVASQTSVETCDLPTTQQTEPDEASIAVKNTSTPPDDDHIDQVRNMLDDLVGRVEKAVSRDEKLLAQVEACVEEKAWREQMFERLKAAVYVANQCVAT